MNKSDVLGMLSEGIVEVQFTKVDGSTRVMLATLDRNIVPTGDADEQKEVNRMADSTQPVWDTIADGWRSFKWNTVTSVNKMVTPGGVS